MKNKNNFLFLATHYDGEAPDNAADFWNWMLNEKNHKKDIFHGMNIGIFALGDVNYKDTFVKFGKDVKYILEKYGANFVTR